MIATEEYRIVDIVEEVKNVRTYRVAPILEKPVKFIPGQFVMLHLLKEDGKTFGDARAYSISSSPIRDSSIDLTIKVYGNFTQKLWKVGRESPVGVRGPYGKFCFIDSEVKEAVFIAGGVGIAPIMGMIQYCFDKKLDVNMILLYSNKKADEIIFYDRLNKLAEQNGKFKVHYTVTQPDENIRWDGDSGRFDEQKISRYVGDVKEKSFFICGSPEMTQDIVSILQKLGADPGKIKREQW
ncbi:hypothetical protein HY570_02925 [Candidatus Micrarchaeota archaeon]|nr:hypothetical protein [Candidatus Micrarchaeota archaeon]